MIVGIVGGGISGLMAAYRLIEKSSDIKVVIFEKGNDILNRKCPILAKKVDKCIKCKHCAIMEGMAGVQVHLVMVSIILLLNLVVGCRI